MRRPESVVILVGCLCGALQSTGQVPILRSNDLRRQSRRTEHRMEMLVDESRNDDAISEFVGYHVVGTHRLDNRLQTSDTHKFSVSNSNRLDGWLCIIHRDDAPGAIDDCLRHVSRLVNIL